MKFKKSTLISLVIITLIGLTNCSKNDTEKENSDLVKMKLNGKVKSIEKLIYSVIENGEDISKGDRAYYEDYGWYKSFNKNGYYTEETIYKNTSNGILSQVKSYYTEDVKIGEEILAANGKTVKKEIKYEENKIVGYNLKTLDGNLSERIEYKYNGDSISNEIFYDENNILEQSISYEYDKNFNKISQTIFDDKEKLTYKNISKYDENNILISSEKYKGEENELVYLIEYNYDKNGNIIEQKNYYYDDGEKEMEGWQKFTYDEKNYMTEYFKLSDGGDVDIKITYEYDDYGNIIKEQTFQGGKHLFKDYKFEYKYDDENNWIEKIVYDDDKPIRIIVRNIIYWGETESENETVITSENISNTTQLCLQYVDDYEDIKISLNIDNNNEVTGNVECINSTLGYSKVSITGSKKERIIDLTVEGGYKNNKSKFNSFLTISNYEMSGWEDSEYPIIFKVIECK